jgi:mono/diheme cytochrome c family protein
MRTSANRCAAVITLSLIGAGVRLAQAAAPAPDPARVYAATCHFCHDTGIAPPIRGSHYPPAQIRFVVRHGDGAMIAFNPAAISHAELAALIVWLDRTAPEKHPAGAHP